MPPSRKTPALATTGPLSWFAGRLWELREAAGLMREQLADRTRLSLHRVGELETQRAAPTWADVVAICEALGVSSEERRRPPTVQPPQPRRGRPRKGYAHDAMPR